MAWQNMGQKCNEFTFTSKGNLKQIVCTDKDISIDFSRKCDCSKNWQVAY